MINNFKFSVLDGHIDTIKKSSRDNRDFSVRSEIGHYDLPRMEEGNVQAAIFAIYPASSINRILKGLDLCGDLSYTLRVLEGSIKLFAF